MSDNYFTLYWIGGRREVIKGETIEAAFTAKGYGGGAIRAIDWYSDRADDTHYYTKKDGWVCRTPVEITEENFKANYDKARVTEVFNLSHSFAVVLPNKDKVVIEQEIGNYATVGLVKHIVIMYLEHNQGSYGGGDDPDAEHFMVCNAIYQHADKVEEAVSNFFDYYGHLTDKSVKSPVSVPLEEIQQTQQL